MWLISWQQLNVVVRQNETIKDKDHIHAESRTGAREACLSFRNSVSKSLSVSYGKLTSVSKAGFEDN